MVSPLQSATSTQAAKEADPADALVSASNSNGMGKDAFMKLLVAQISQQNPLKPMDDTQFVAQLAQFSALEQTMGINKRLDDLATRQQGAANTALGSLVGKSITVRGTMTTLDSSGIGAPITFTLDENCTSVEVKIADASGKAVRTLNVLAQSTSLTRAALPKELTEVGLVARTRGSTSPDKKQRWSLPFKAQPARKPRKKPIRPMHS